MDKTRDEGVFNATYPEDYKSRYEHPYGDNLWGIMRKRHVRSLLLDKRH